MPSFSTSNLPFVVAFLAGLHLLRKKKITRPMRATPKILLLMTIASVALLERRVAGVFGVAGLAVALVGSSVHCALYEAVVKDASTVAGD